MIPVPTKSHKSFIFTLKSFGSLINKTMPKITEAKNERKAIICKEENPYAFNFFIKILIKPHKIPAEITLK